MRTGPDWLQQPPHKPLHRLAMAPAPARQDGTVPLVPRAGVEPARPCGHRFLRPTRLPFRHLGAALFPPFGEARQYHSPVRLTVAAGLCLILAAACVQVSPPGNPTANQATTPSASSAASGPRFSQPPVTP